MDAILKYFDAEEELFNYFGFEQGNHLYYPTSALSYWWAIIQHKVIYCPIPFTKECIDDGSKLYGEEISLDRVFKKDKYAAICVNECTGDRVFMIFDGKKECKDPELLLLLEDV